MSKNKDIEKPQIEKRKDFKIEKLEKEHKEPWKEKIEHKEFKELKQEIKEKPERKEFKEPIKEKVEHKEFKEFEKQVPEKGGKEIAEGGFDPGELIQPRSNVADTGDLGTASTAAAAKTFEKQLEKVQKDLEKIKPEKEHIKHELKDFKNEKIERKELKFEKLEIKEQKLEILEKHHHKDILPDKHVFENDPKGIVENPGSGFPGVDPATPVFKAEGPPEERLKELEEAVTKLAHFIGVDLRPDLSSGALKSEPDVAGAKTDEPKTDDKNKKR